MATFILLVDIPEEDPNECDRIAERFVKDLVEGIEIEIAFADVEQDVGEYNVRCTWVQ